MKKTFLFAALAALSMVSCMNEEFPTLTPTKGYGYINVNVSNDVEMKTRAGEDESSEPAWILKLGEEVLEEKTKKFAAGNYTVSAASHESVDAALALDNNYGVPYYFGEEDFELLAGQTKNITIDCGRAKNSKLSLITTGLNSSVFSNVTLYAQKGDRYLTTNGIKSIFYKKGTNVSYYITYDYTTINENGVSSTNTVTLKNNEQDFNISIAAPGTDYQIILTSTTNGTIIVSVSYDETFDEVGTSVELDAATGLPRN